MRSLEPVRVKDSIYPKVPCYLNLISLNKFKNILDWEQEERNPTGMYLLVFEGEWQCYGHDGEDIVKFEKCLPISIYEKNNNTICARDMGITGFKDGKTEYHLLDVYGLKLDIDKNRYIIRLEDWAKICD